MLLSKPLAKMSTGVVKLYIFKDVSFSLGVLTCLGPSDRLAKP